MDTRELAWASGIFDGEGCIYSQDGRPYLQVAMTDEDSVRRFHAAVGGLGTVRPFSGSRTKTMWRWRLTNFEGVQAVIAMLWYGLSRRRKDYYHFNYQPRSGN
jgi:hypothetical protein